MKRILLLLAALALAGCPSKSTDPAKTIDAEAPAATDAATTAKAADAGGSVQASGKATWSGPYTLAPATISIPTDNKDYNGVKQAKDDPSKHMGEGKIELTIDGDRVTGTVEGAAGPAVVDGTLVGGEIRGFVRRKDPKDDGLTGTLTAKIAGGDAEGKLSLADGTSAIVREAKIALKKK